jgi:hypothetical protein
MRSHLIVRLAIAAVMLAGAAGSAFATASPAAAIQQCQSYTYHADYGVASSASGSYVYVDDIDYCNPGPGGNLLFPVSISKYIGNQGWVVVATGTGSARYTCTGGRYLYTTSVTTAQNKPAFYCG